jgi:hypothetical protein
VIDDPGSGQFVDGVNRAQGGGEIDDPVGQFAIGTRVAGDGPEVLESQPTPSVSPELKVLMRRLKLGQLVTRTPGPGPES